MACPPGTRPWGRIQVQCLCRQLVLTSSPISLSDVVQLSKQTYGSLETYDAQLDAMYGSQAYDDAVYGPEPAHEAAFAFKVSREGQALIRASTRSTHHTDGHSASISASGNRRSTVHRAAKLV